MWTAAVNISALLRTKQMANMKILKQHEDSESLFTPGANIHVDYSHTSLFIHGV